MLLNLREILEPAVKDNFAVGGFNVTESTMFKAIVEEAQYREAPAIIQVSPNEFQFSERELYLYFSVRLQRSRNPFVLHYDHSKSYEGCIRAIQAGFTSVMFDGSQMEYDQNVECTRRVVEAAHGAGVSVEGEIGTIGETEDYLNGTVRDMVYTSPELARRFVEDTGVDALAVSIGTVHGLLEFKHAYYQSVREFVTNHPTLVSPTLVLKNAVQEVRNVAGTKMQVLGSTGKSHCYRKY